MAHIVVFGGTGFAGRNIVHEAAGRGHSVEVVTTTRVLDGSTKDQVDFEQGSVHDAELVDRLARGADVLAVAIPARELDGQKLVEAVPALAAAAAEHGARLAFVGGAGSLKVSEDGPRLLDTPDFPADAKPEAAAHAEVLAALEATPDDVDWFYLSPSAAFGAAVAGAGARAPHHAGGGRAGG
ncbi:MAG: NAD(P)H-binding protein, partial [Cellulomonadaceae bacterium]